MRPASSVAKSVMLPRIGVGPASARRSLLARFIHIKLSNDKGIKVTDYLHPDLDMSHFNSCGCRGDGCHFSGEGDRVVLPCK